MEIAPWFENENYHGDERYLSLPVQQKRLVDAYRENGFVVLEDAGMDLATIDRTVESLDSLAPSSGYFVGGRLQDAWRDFASVRNIATCGKVLETLNILYQRDPIPFQTLNFRTGTQQRAHSDTIHFNTLPYGFMCGVWVALEDTDAENGALFYYAGSQRLPVFHMHDFGPDSSRGGDGALEDSRNSYKRYEDKVEEVLRNSSYVPQQAHLKKGQALIWSANIFHGGSKLIDSSRTRKSQVTHYYFPGCIYYTPLLSSPLEQRWTLRQIADIRTQQVTPTYTGIDARRTRLSLMKEFLKKIAKR